MKKIILLLFIFLSFNLFGEEEYLRQIKINKMLADKEFYFMDEDKLYGTYTDTEEEVKINKEIINKCIDTIHSVDIQEGSSILNKGGFYVLDNNKLANGYYNIKTNKVPVNLYLIHNGQFKEWYRYSEETQKQIIGGIYNVAFFDNITYDNFINSQKNISVLGSMDRTHYFFEVNEKKQLTVPIMYIKDHIEKVAIFKNIPSDDISILYKVYKTIKIFYITGELMVDANFECFSIQGYKSVYPMFEDYKIEIGFGMAPLFTLNFINKNGEENVYKVNKINVYNKDGTINKNETDSIDPNSQLTDYYTWLMMSFLSDTIEE